MRYVFTFTLSFFLLSGFAQNFSNCLQFKDFKIVVIGSSTAAGTGASVRDSAWVNRYRTHLQNINAGNEVVNLAMGGYSTYRLLPSGTTNPMNRPEVDTMRNITAAIAEAPDAIIINLPSNDAASGWAAMEQLDNFQTIYETAQQAHIPIWICTTQPRNFSANQVQIQLQVRDSIFARYGDFTLDFWSDAATPDGTLDILYNSGDGVHLNDLGHRKIFERARDKMIPQYLFEETVVPDYEVKSFEQLGGYTCSDDSIEVELVYSNLGFQQLDSIFVEFDYLNGNYQRSFLAAELCKLDTIQFAVSSLANEGSGSINSSLDTLETNNQFTATFSIIDSPVIDIETEIRFCETDSFFLTPFFAEADTFFWYENEISQTPIVVGSNFQTNLISNDTTFYIEGINGDLFYKNSLFTTGQFNRDWNGIMFDLVATEPTIVDGFSINMFSTGTQVIEIFTKTGSLIGAELDAAQWTLFKIDTLQVSTSGEYAKLNNLDLALSTNDTVGIYLQLQDPTADMNYFATNSLEVIQDSVISLSNGTGITHNFSETYFPRLFSGEVFYHHGYRQEGDCSTGRIPVSLIYEEPIINLGADTVLGVGDSIVLAVDSTFDSQQWSNGSTDDSITIYYDDLMNVENIFTVNAINDLECTATDTIIVYKFISSILNVHSELNYQLFPNPGNQFFEIKGKSGFANISVLNATGQLRFKLKTTLPSSFNWSQLETGVYFLKIESDEGLQIIRFQNIKE